MAAEREQAMMSVTVNVTRSVVIKWLGVLAVGLAVLALRGGLGGAGAVAAEVEDWEMQVAAKTPEEGAAAEPPAGHNPGHELVLNLVEPCVAFDTRSGGGKLAAGQNRTFAVVGPTRNLSAQGGAPGGCGIANDAQAVLINVVAIDPAGGGNLRAHAGDLPPQDGSGVVNYQKFADNLNNSNQIVLSVRAADKGVDDVLVGANGAAVHVRGIVSGYYTVNPHKVQTVSTSRSVTNATSNYEAVACPTGTVVVGGGGYSNVFNLWVIEYSYPLGNTAWAVRYTKRDGVAGNQIMTVYARCLSVG